MSFAYHGRSTRIGQRRGSGSLECPPISNTQNGFAVSLLSMGNSVPATPNLGAPAGPGMMAAPLVDSNRTRTRTLCEIRWPEAIWAPAILETLAEQSKRSLSQSRESLLRPHRPWRLFSNTTATPVSPLLALLALCSLWQLYGRSPFDDCCLGCLPLLHLRPFVDWAGH